MNTNTGCWLLLIPPQYQPRASCSDLVLPGHHFIGVLSISSPRFALETSNRSESVLYSTDVWGRQQATLTAAPHSVYCVIPIALWQVWYQHFTLCIYIYSRDTVFTVDSIGCHWALVPMSPSVASRVTVLGQCEACCGHISNALWATSISLFPNFLFGFMDKNMNNWVRKGSAWKHVGHHKQVLHWTIEHFTC